MAALITNQTEMLIPGRRRKYTPATALDQLSGFDTRKRCCSLHWPVTLVVRKRNIESLFARYLLSFF
nr:hypothetical protein CFP56_57226 [Quercus suber]